MEAQAPPRKRRVWLLVTGSIVGLVALLALAGGGLALWTEATDRDGGYFSANAHRYSTPTRAITTGAISIGGIHCDPQCELPGWIIGKARLEVTSAKPVFVGIGPVEKVEAYLGHVRHATAKDLDLEPFAVTYVTHPGSAVPASPAAQHFWTASAAGSGTTSLTWKAKSGDWSIVVMNADGSPGVSADVSAGVSAPWLLWAGIGVTIFGALLAAGAALMLVSGHGRGGDAPPAGASSVELAPAA